MNTFFNFFFLIEFGLIYVTIWNCDDGPWVIQEMWKVISLVFNGQSYSTRNLGRKMA